MSLDDDRMPWPAQEAIERGENPQREDTAQFRLARLLAEHDHIHSAHHQMIVAGRVLAFLPRIVAWSEQDKPAAKATQLRRQQVASLSDEDEALERAHWHLKGYREAMRSLVAMGSVHAKDYDPDERGEAEDDRRAKEQRQDEAANENAPTAKGAA